MRTMLCLIVVLMAAAAGGERRETPKRRIACKTPENAASCYWTHGRLAFYNGTPSYRLWKIGTHRVLGIYSGPGSEEIDPLDNENPELPDNVTEKFSSLENRIFADFEVCPLEEEEPGVMQRACIESAKKIVVQTSW